MWIEFVFQPTSLFSLKASDATNSASKSLLSPSPYSVKMALLNAICTFDSVKTAERYFTFIRDTEMQFSLPEFIVVNNCFIKIVKKDDHPKKPEDLFISTVAFREFVYFSGEIKIAVKIQENSTVEQIEFLKSNFCKINYFGKRASFFQFTKWTDEPIYELPIEYSRGIDDPLFKDNRHKIIMKVDDFSPDITFNSVNSYSNEKN